MKDLLVKQPPKQNMPSDPSCKLPISPNYDVDFIEAGYRFYSLQEQYLAFNKLPGFMSEQYDISISIRTSYPSGMLFYAASQKSKDFIAVYLLDGRVHHQVRVGDTDQANISSKQDLIDENWHTVQFVRTNSRISLSIDGIEQEGSVDLYSEHNIRPPSLITFPVYVGGINKYLEVELKDQFNFVDNSYYNGCIRDIKVNGLALEEEPMAHHVVPCSEQVESGVFFHQDKGYVKLFERFTVGADVTISFDFRPRDPNGLLFSVHGKSSYLILELINNTVTFTVKSDAKNTVVTNYTLPDNASYCDGKWRNVLAIKSKFVITIAVDHVSSQPGLGNDSSAFTKTHRPLFMGGHHAFNKAPGIKTRKTFSGCMKNVKINNKDISITKKLIFGDIWQGVCPLN